MRASKHSSPWFLLTADSESFTMKIIRNLEDIKPGAPSVVTIGVFDGVHLGHQEIMRIVGSTAQARGARSVVVTFDRNPEEIVHPSNPVPYITTLPQKLDLIAQQGIDLTVVLPLEKWLVDMPAEDFVSRILHEKLGAVQVVVGPDFVFGKGRAGNTELLRRLGEGCGYDVTTVPPIRVGDFVVSSTAIRRLISEGDVDRANELLGHPFSLTGKVVRGEGVGRSLGFPTANIEAPEKQILPGNGIYALAVMLDGRRWIGVSNIGNRPTLGGAKTTLEVYILDFSGNIYDRELELIFLHRLRDEIKFPDVDALKRQIALDVETARRLTADN